MSIPNSWGGIPAPVGKPTISGFGEVSYGAKFELLGGSKYEFMAGTKNAFLLGIDNKFSIGAKTDISAGSELKISVGPKWESPKSKWWPAQGFLAKYDFSTIKEHKLIISKDGSTDILVKKSTLGKEHFQASAGYGQLGNAYYDIYTSLVSSMVHKLVYFNALLQALNLANGLTVNPAQNTNSGFDITDQARTSWIPIAAQMFATYGQLVSAVNVVLHRDVLKKAIMPNSVLQLRDGKGSFLGNRIYDCLTGIEMKDTIKIGARKPPAIESWLYDTGVESFYKKEAGSGEIESFTKQPESYFEVSPDKAIFFSKALEIHANKDQKTKVNSKAGLNEQANILIKAEGGDKPKIVAESKNITLRTGSKTDANVKLMLNQEKNKARLTIDKAEKNGLIMNVDTLNLKSGNGQLEINKEMSVLKKNRAGAVVIKNDMIAISSGGNRFTLSSQGAKINGNVIVTK